jgi:hypothetical protein
MRFSLILRQRYLRALPGSKLSLPGTPAIPHYFTTGTVVGNNGDGTATATLAGAESTVVLPYHGSYSPQQGDVVRVLRYGGSGEILDKFATTPLAPISALPNPPVQVQAAATLYSGIGAPTFSANAGDRYYRIDTPGTSGQREYICTGGTSWTALTI